MNNTLTITKQFAVICAERAQLEKYNPDIEAEYDTLEEAEDHQEMYGDLRAYYIVERGDDGNAVDVETGETFRMNDYR